MHNSSRGSMVLKMTLAVLASGFAACGSKEVSQMEKFADQMCACTTVECAEKIYPELEKFANANEGKEVEASAADKYAAAMDRTQKCFEKVHTDAAKAEDKK